MAGTVDDNLQRALKTRAARKKIYKNTHQRHGDVMQALFPKGISITTPSEFARFGALNMIVSKVCRYTARPEQGHADSAHDLIVYGAILEELT
jgi:hypothetical protein